MRSFFLPNQMEMNMQWSDRFDSKEMTPDNLEKARIARIWFKDLANHLENNLPEGEYKKRVLWKLEETAMLTTKSLSHTMIDGESDEISA